MCHTIRERVVKTRKPWTCFGCGRQMPKGSQCEVHATIGDGRLYGIRLCDVCSKVRRQVVHYGDVYLKGELLSENEDLWNEEAANLEE